jgi:hypothetical protein
MTPLLREMLCLLGMRLGQILLPLRPLPLLPLLGLAVVSAGTLWVLPENTLGWEPAGHHDTNHDSTDMPSASVRDSTKIPT